MRGDGKFKRSVKLRILLDGYIDNNFGDDLMLYIAADGLKEHKLYITSPKLNIAEYTEEKSGFDCYLKVTGSGFLIHNNKGIVYRMRDMYREKRYSKNRAVINCNISDFINRFSEKLIQKQISEYDFVTVRDRYSYEYITQNIPNVKCEKYPDIVLSLSDEMIPNVNSENVLGISVHKSADVNVFAEIADRFINETGRNVCLLCFNTGSEDDISVAENIYGIMKNKHMTEIVKYTDINNMLKNLKRCGVILGIRFHSVILALRLGIPFVPIAYSYKTKNALDEIGYNGKIYDVNNFRADEVLKSILNSAPYVLDNSIINSAENHIKRFDEYIKRIRL